MKPRLLAILVLIVCLPLIGLAWLGIRLAQGERADAEARFARAAAGRLADVNSVIRDLIEVYEAELTVLTESAPAGCEAAMALARDRRIVRQVFVLDREGRIQLPDTSSGMSRNERSFLRRTRAVWESGETFFRAGDANSLAARTYGWHTWFWGNGLNLIFWQHLADGRVVGVEIHPAALAADAIGRLPDTGSLSGRESAGRIVLSDTSGRAVYAWGTHQPADDEEPDAVVAVSPPLGAWSLRYYAPDGAEGFGAARLFILLSGIGGAALAVGALAVYFYRESAREMRAAARRVSFVNQVSHEFKTPLTNIRMYAELLERQIPQQHDKARHHLAVVLSETRRLGRLIANVLTFARERRDPLRLHMLPAVIDETVASVIDGFRPAFEERGIEVELDRGAAGRVCYDEDALEQILGNLLSNVDKYAGRGGYLGVVTRQQDGRTVINVRDRGPGIPASQRERVFAPFVRLSDRLSDGVTGTGIGLSIARDLARKHGGDLVVLETPGPGADFEITLHTPSADGVPDEVCTDEEDR